MSSYLDHALHVLKHKGYRITQPRKHVLEILNQAKTALSAYEIKDLLDQTGDRVDTVSVYRILECLEENHLIHRLLQTGKVRKCQLEDEDHCERDEDNHCHHLLICRKCNAIEEVHCLSMAQVVAQVQQESRFRVESHHLEFIGLCQKCR